VTTTLACPPFRLLMAVPDNPGRTDAGLVARARKGDPSALDEIVRRHQTRVFNLACRMLRNREEAEDVAQEAFLRAFDALPRLRDDASFGSWLCRIAANLCLARLRSAAWRAEVPTDPSLLPGLEADRRDAPTPDFSDAVRSAITRLPPKYRLAVVAFYLEGRSYAEAARAFGMPVRTFKTRLYRARKMLRDTLGEGETAL